MDLAAASATLGGPVEKVTRFFFFSIREGDLPVSMNVLNESMSIMGADDSAVDVVDIAVAPPALDPRNGLPDPNGVDTAGDGDEEDEDEDGAPLGFLLRLRILFGFGTGADI